MKKPLSYDDLSRKLEAIDFVHDETALPHYLRSADAFEQIYGSIHDQPQRGILFNDIQKWYLKRHGELATWTGEIGKAPIFICGALHIATITFTENDKVADIFGGIPSVTPDFKKTLDAATYKEIAERKTQAGFDLNALYQLRIDKRWLKAEAFQLLLRGFFDLDGIVPAIERSDTQTSIHHSHQMVEKFLKGIYVELGGTKGPKSFSHKCGEILDELVRIDNRLTVLREPINELEKAAEGPQIKYDNMPRTLEDAVSCYYSALAACGGLSGILLLDRERGSRDSKYRPARFYQNRSGLVYWCVAADNVNATVIAFEDRPLRGMGPIKITGEQIYGCYSLLITDRARLNELSAILSSQINSGNEWGPLPELHKSPRKWGSMNFLFSQRKR